MSRQAVKVCAATGCWSKGESLIPGINLCPPHRDAVERALAEKPELPTFTGLIYYVTFDRGETVKIGTTTTPRARFNALCARERVPFELLAAEPGHYKEERALHRRFAHLEVRYRGRREFFRLDDELRAHLDEVRLRNPNWRTLPDDIDERRNGRTRR